MLSSSCGALGAYIALTWAIYIMSPREARASRAKAFLLLGVLPRALGEEFIGSSPLRGMLSLNCNTFLYLNGLIL
jgi:hypothetical protein